MDSIVSVTTECYLTIIYMRQVKVMASDGSATAGSETGSLDPSLPGTGYDTQYLHALPHSAPKKKIRRYAGQNHKSGKLPLYLSVS